MDIDPIRILLVEDDEDDYLLTSELLAEIPGRPFHVEWAREYAAALEEMIRSRHDLYLVDYRLGGRNGLDLMREARRQACPGPIILLTGQGERDVDLEAMKGGAADYLIKGQIDPALLERSIRYAIDRQRHREALRHAHDELEKRVHERTAALEEANAALRLEIAERERVEQALMEADRRKDEFLAMLAHELRNPLAPIRNGLYILRNPNAKGATSGRVIHMMEQEVRNLTRLVDDLLDVSRITRGKIHLRKETIDLAAAVAHAVEVVRPLLDAQRHHLALSLPEEPLHLEADPTRLEQILCNLLNNAAKYTESGGRIELNVERRDGMVAIRLRDTGIGIAPDLLPKIFDLFTQADRSLARSQGGLGIGLTLVRKLVEMMGGTVAAHSDGPGKGSEFVVRLPVLTTVKRSEPAEPLDRGGPKEEHFLRVLVVEDIEEVAEMLAILLKQWGHEVRTVHDGPSALVAARTFQPEVVLLDLGLPGMNGFDVARQLRLEKFGTRPTIVAVTGYGQEEDRRRSQEAGFDEHMIKPIDPKALQAFLESKAESPCAAAAIMAGVD